jgi:Zn-dependent peptidase ImmA (M78 family)
VETGMRCGAKPHKFMDMVKIAGITYNIELKSKEEMNGLVGSADFNRQLISINKEHTEQTQRIAVYHEILHLLSDAYGLKLTEEQVKIGTHALIAFVEENKDILTI